MYFTLLILLLTAVVFSDRPAIGSRCRRRRRGAARMGRGGLGDQRQKGRAGGDDCRCCRGGGSSASLLHLLWQAREREAARAKLRAERAHIGAAIGAAMAAQLPRLSALFQQWDTDGDGTVGPAEFRTAVLELGVEGTEEVDADLLFGALDRDESGATKRHYPSPLTWRRATDARPCPLRA